MKEDHYDKIFREIEEERQKEQDELRQTLYEAMQGVANKYTLIRNIPSPDLEDFSLKTFDVKDVIGIESADCQVLLTKSSSGSSDLYYPMGFIRTRASYPITFVQPETLYHKLHELFSPVEIDFNQNKAFSSKYYVLSENEQLLRQVFPNPVLELLAGYDSLMLELRGNSCLFRTDTGSMNADNLILTFDVAAALHACFNGSFLR